MPGMSESAVGVPFRGREGQPGLDEAAGRARTRWPRALRGPWTLSVEALILWAAGLWTLTANSAFFAAALKDRAWTEPATWGFGLALAVLLMSLNVLLLAVLAHRWTIKPVLTLLLVVTA